MSRLDGQAALVTHGAQGLGAAIAQRLEQEGARVHAVAALPDSPEAANAMVQAAATSEGRLDILVNAEEAAPALAPLERKQWLVAPSAQRVMWIMQAAFPLMREQGSGRIVNVVALHGDSLNRQLSDAVATSEAIKSLTRSAAEEWGSHGILVNAIAPAADTEAFRALRAGAPDAVDALVAASPMGRMGDPVADIGGAVMLLVSDAGRFLTGHVLYADGGQHLTPSPFEAVVPSE